MNKTSASNYIDLLRIIACSLVLLAHVCGFGIDSLPLPSPSFAIVNAYDNLGVIGVPLFVMISGALLLREDYKISLGKLFLSKIIHIYLIYNIWLVIYNLINCYQEGYGYAWASIKQNVLLNSLLGRGIYHLWFIPMMISLYLILPILKKIASDRETCRYFLILFFFIAILMPTILKFHFRFETIVRSQYERIPFVMCIGYVGYFVLGHYLHSFVEPLSKKKCMLLGFAGLLFWNAGHLLCLYRSYSDGIFSTLFNDPFTLNDWIVSISIFLLGKSLYTAPKENPGIKSRTGIIHLLSKYTFGIYLIHPAFLMIYSWLNGNITFIPVLISVPICVFVLFSISTFVIFILSKIPVIRLIIF